MPTDPQTIEVSANILELLFDVFKEVKTIFWMITIYSLTVGGAMTFFGKKHLKKLLFLVGAFTVYLPMSIVSSTSTALLVALVTGLVMAFCYIGFVFLIGGMAMCCICLSLGMGGAIAGVLGVAAGIVAVIYRKKIVIPLTAYSGASMLVIGLVLLFAGMFLAIMPMAVAYILLVLFFGSGMFVQYKYTGKDPVIPAGETNNTAEAK